MVLLSISSRASESTDPVGVQRRAARQPSHQKPGMDYAQTLCNFFSLDFAAGVGALHGPASSANLSRPSFAAWAPHLVQTQCVCVFA